MSFDKHNLHVFSHFRHSLEDRWNIFCLIPGWNNDRDSLVVWNEALVRLAPGNCEIGYCQVLKWPKLHHKFITQVSNARNIKRAEYLFPGSNGLKTCEIEQVIDILSGEPILSQHGFGKIELLRQVQ